MSGFRTSHPSHEDLTRTPRADEINVTMVGVFRCFFWSFFSNMLSHPPFHPPPPNSDLGVPIPRPSGERPCMLSQKRGPVVFTVAGGSGGSRAETSPAVPPLAHRGTPALRAPRAPAGSDADGREGGGVDVRAREWSRHVYISGHPYEGLQLNHHHPLLHRIFGMLAKFDLRALTPEPDLKDSLISPCKSGPQDPPVGVPCLEA